LIRVRRLLGLWCFAWATLHLTSYTLLELGINNLALLGSEIITRPYLTLGMISWAILLALARPPRKRCSENWASLATFAQLRLSGGDPRADSLPVVSEDRLAAARHLCPAGGLLAWRYKKFRQWWR
jgi:sulfoxide reductase heme-binding subunit YedZ